MKNILIILFCIYGNAYGQVLTHDEQELYLKEHAADIKATKHKLDSLELIRQKQPIDSQKIYYHKFLYFNNKLNDPKLSIKKFEMIEDSAKKYLELLNRQRK